MLGTLRPRVKVCCISSIEEAQLAIQYGANAIGLVGEMPSGPGVISDGLINEIAQATPPGVASFLLTSKTSAAAIIAHHKQTQTNTIQIVDEIELTEYAKIRSALPTVKLLQVIHVLNADSVEKAKAIAPFVDAILLDSGNPNLRVKELGGTGRTHNWKWSKQIRAAIDKPTFLAGGLNADNIQAAIRAVQPFGVDLCSGVRTNGKLDEEKLKRFFEAVRTVV